MKILFRSERNLPSIIDIENWERQIGFQLPKEYKVFLLTVNGGSKPDRSHFYLETCRNHYGDSVLRALYSYESEYFEDGLQENYGIYTLAGRISQNMLPIGEDYFGNLICISISGSDKGKIYFWDHEEENDTTGNLYLLAENFDEFISILK